MIEAKVSISGEGLSGPERAVHVGKLDFLVSKQDSLKRRGVKQPSSPHATYTLPRSCVSSTASQADGPYH